MKVVENSLTRIEEDLLKLLRLGGEETINSLSKKSGHSWSTTRFYLFQLERKRLVECRTSDTLSVGGHLDKWRIKDGVHV